MHVVELGHGVSSAPLCLSGTPRQRPEFPAKQPEAPRFAEALKRQFRELVKHLTGKAPAPKPTPRRRRTEETRGGFKLATVKIMRRIVRTAAPPETPWDAMTWQHFWGEHFWAECSDAAPGDFSDCDRPEAFQESSGFSPNL